MKKVLFTLFAALFIVAASCKKDDPKPAPGKDDPKTPPTEQTVNVTGVTLDKTLILEKGKTGTLTATIEPSNATNKSVTWKSSNKEVADVDTNGKITALELGETTITVTTVDGNKTATCEVTVVNETIAVTGVTLDQTTLSLTIGNTQLLKATIAPANATNKSVTWNSSNPAVVSVSDGGNLEAKSVGEATITVTTVDGGKTATCKVTVAPIAVTGVYLNSSSITLAKAETKRLSATIMPSNATNQKISWKSNNTSVATVDGTGLVTAVSGGTATITVTTDDGKKTATCQVTVTIPVTSVSLGHYIYRLYKGDSEEFTVTVYPSNATDKRVNWTIDDTSVANITSSSATKCKIKANKAGYATLTATSYDGNKVAKMTISVMDDSNLQVWKNTGNGKTSIPVATIFYGSFKMGNSSGSAPNSEKPQHNVTLTKSYYMGLFEITNQQYAEFLNAKGAGFNGKVDGKDMIIYNSSDLGITHSSANGWQPIAGKEHHPMVCVLYEGAAAFAEWAGGRLPTEAEWEYACRAGTTSLTFWGSYTSGYDEGYALGSVTTTKAVGQSVKPNPWGLYNMVDNVQEYVSDYWGYYTAADQTNPKGPATPPQYGYSRVIRGGSFINNTVANRTSTARFQPATDPQTYSKDRGFRVVFDI